MNAETLDWVLSGILITTGLFICGAILFLFLGLFVWLAINYPAAVVVLMMIGFAIGFYINEHK